MKMTVSRHSRVFECRTRNFSYSHWTDTHSYRRLLEMVSKTHHNQWHRTGTWKGSHQSTANRWRRPPHTRRSHTLTDQDEVKWLVRSVSVRRWKSGRASSPLPLFHCVSSLLYLQSNPNVRRQQKKRRPSSEILRGSTPYLQERWEKPGEIYLMNLSKKASIDYSWRTSRKSLLVAYLTDCEKFYVSNQSISEKIRSSEISTSTSLEMLWRASTVARRT